MYGKSLRRKRRLVLQNARKVCQPPSALSRLADIFGSDASPERERPEGDGIGANAVVKNALNELRFSAKTETSSIEKLAGCIEKPAERVQKPAERIEKLPRTEKLPYKPSDQPETVPDINPKPKLGVGLKAALKAGRGVAKKVPRRKKQLVNPPLASQLDPASTSLIASTSTPLRKHRHDVLADSLLETYNFSGVSPIQDVPQVEAPVATFPTEEILAAVPAEASSPRRSDWVQNLVLLSDDAIPIACYAIQPTTAVIQKPQQSPKRKDVQDPADLSDMPLVNVRLVRPAKAKRKRRQPKQPIEELTDAQLYQFLLSQCAPGPDPIDIIGWRRCAA